MPQTLPPTLEQKPPVQASREAWNSLAQRKGRASWFTESSTFSVSAARGESPLILCVDLRYEMWTSEMRMLVTATPVLQGRLPRHALLCMTAEPPDRTIAAADTRSGSRSSCKTPRFSDCSDNDVTEANCGQSLSSIVSRPLRRAPRPANCSPLFPGLLAGLGLKLFGRTGLMAGSLQARLTQKTGPHPDEVPTTH
jgi:hypothetical protein